MMFKTNQVVLVSSSVNHVKQPLLHAIEHFKIEPQEMNFIEVGSGYGKILDLAAKEFEWKSLIAIEIDFLTIMIARFSNLIKRMPITFVHKDIFDYEIPKGSLVYCYMSTPIISRLFDEGAFENCVVLSLTFPIQEIPCSATYDVEGFQKRLFVYDFR
ncbi:class I SAM-dependent methyltransferase [Aggregatimonas sangjinii]|uniref:Class I SAM-dependent methyltransferase n=1 Tax=Aggregatimonas sangjinii TaxID=2583587 RepID=A0A5B7SPX4_9FLAO|nr:class I SAM-dependent methyltransferase [Aggregatimonas sangjinii]QCX00636.1 class I SAM-dependent methyltransferase [Aggregatimonas sangjinii]